MTNDSVLSMSPRQAPPNTEQIALIADVAKALGNPQRLTLLEHLSESEHAVEKLAELASLTIANTSQHLQQLRRAGFVMARRSGKNMLYRLGEGPLAQVLAALRGYADFQQNLAHQAIADSRNSTAQMEGVSVEQLLHRMANGVVVLIDVRPDSEFS